MFPEGLGRVRPFRKVGAAARKMNALLENASLAVDKLWNWLPCVIHRERVET